MALEGSKVVIVGGVADRQAAAGGSAVDAKFGLRVGYADADVLRLERS